MNKNIVFFAIFVITLVMFALFAGCASQSLAQTTNAFDLGRKINHDVVNRLFTKSWNLNAAALNEASQKWLLDAELVMVKATEAGVIPVDRATEVMVILKKELSIDQDVAAANFLYLAVLMRQHERANSLTGLVDFYLGSQVSLVEKLTEHVIEGYDGLRVQAGKLGSLQLLSDLKVAWNAVKNKVVATQPVE